MKIEFLSDLVVCRQAPGWVLSRPFTVAIDGDVLTVPSGFYTDFSSVPRLPLAYYLAGGRGIKGSVIHDYLYETGNRPREEADRIFLFAMLEEGEPRAVAYAMYVAVHSAGGEHYKGDAPPLDVATIESAPPV